MEARNPMPSDLERRIGELEKQAADNDLLSRLAHSPEIRTQSRNLAKQLRKLAAMLREELARRNRDPI
jgi:hypothetical protein